MNHIGKKLIVAVVVFVWGIASAQQTSTPNAAAQSILAVCRAVGISATQAADATACLRILEQTGVIEPRTANNMRFAVSTTTITTGQFAVFLADVLNAAAPAPRTAAAAVAALREDGIVLPSTSATTSTVNNTPITVTAIQNVFSNPTTVQAIQTSYTAPVSPTRP